MKTLRPDIVMMVAIIGDVVHMVMKGSDILEMNIISDVM